MLFIVFSADSDKTKFECQCSPCQIKRQHLKSDKPWTTFKNTAMYAALAHNVQYYLPVSSIYLFHYIRQIVQILLHVVTCSAVLSSKKLCTFLHQYVDRKVCLLIGWVFFIWVAYKASLVELDLEEFDPYKELEIDRVRCAVVSGD